MIENQRALFTMPDGIAYLNCAYTSPLLKTVQKAGNEAVGRKAFPWTITPADFFKGIEAARHSFAELILCSGEDVAIIPAVSYGIALAARNLPVAAGQNILVIEEQFPSNIYSWQRLVRKKQAVIRTVKRPEDHDWTRAVVDAIDGSTAIVAVPNCHWTDGTVLDLVAVGRACRSHGAALVIDGTQSLGALPFSIPDVQPDFVSVTAHKWLLGPYSFGFCYVAPRWQGGIPLEENWLNRSGSEDFSKLVNYRDDYQPGARRFDMGGASNFVLAPMAVAALTQLRDWGVTGIAETLRLKTDRIANTALSLGFRVAPKAMRSPHLIGITLPGGIPDGLQAELVAQSVFVSIRGESVRVAPHLYTTEGDIDRLFEVLRRFVPSS